MGNWIIGFGAVEHEYKIGDVTYIVTSHFAKPTDAEKLTITDRMKRFVGGDFADLTADMDADILTVNMYVRLPERRTHAVENKTE